MTFYGDKLRPSLYETTLKIISRLTFLPYPHHIAIIEKSYKSSNHYRLGSNFLLALFHLPIDAKKKEELTYWLNTLKTYKTISFGY